MTFNKNKDSLSQTQSIGFLRESYAQQEVLIADLKADLGSIKEKRQHEIDCLANDSQRIKVAMQLKEEENYLLNDQIQKLSRSLDDERKQSDFLTKELKETQATYKQTHDKNVALISQLEMDNNEIKKRLVKLIREKAELWQKADQLEYENLLKANAMWLDDSAISNCMSCNSGFSMMLRKVCDFKSTYLVFKHGNDTPWKVPENMSVNNFVSNWFNRENWLQKRRLKTSYIDRKREKVTFGEVFFVWSI